MRSPHCFTRLRSFQLQRRGRSTFGMFAWDSVTIPWQHLAFQFCDSGRGCSIRTTRVLTAELEGNQGTRENPVSLHCVLHRSGRDTRRGRETGFPETSHGASVWRVQFPETPLRKHLETVSSGARLEWNRFIRWFVDGAGVFCCFLETSSFAQRTGSALQFEEYLAAEVSGPQPVEPKITDPVHRMYRTRIRNGIEKGWGVFREEQKRKGLTSQDI